MAAGSTPPSPSSAGVTGGAAGGWSDRFEQGLHPAIERFNASIGFDITLLQEDLDGSVAHARMLGRCGVITEPEADRLIEGLELIRGEAAAGEFQPTIEAEDVHFAVERRLIELLGPLGKKLHTGRSRNDQVGTDLRLWLRRRIDQIEQALLRFERALLAQAEAITPKLLAAHDQAEAATTLLPPQLRAMAAEIATLSDQVSRRYFALLPAARAVGVDLGQAAIIEA